MTQNNGIQDATKLTENIAERIRQEVIKEFNGHREMILATLGILTILAAIVFFMVANHFLTKELAPHSGRGGLPQPS